MLYVEPGLATGMTRDGAARLWAVILIFSLSFIVWGGMKLVSHLGLFFAAVVGMALRHE